MTRHWIRLLSRAPRVWLSAFLALTAALATPLWDFSASAPGLRIETAVEMLLPDHDADRAYYDAFRQRFGNDEVVLLVLTSDDVLTAEGLAAIQRVSASVAALAGIERVLSIANALDVRSAADGVLVEPFLAEVPDDPAELARIRARILDNPVYAGSLVSHDARAAALVVYPKTMSEHEFRERGLDEALARIAAEERGGVEVLISGAPPVKAATSRLVLRDATLSTAIGAATSAAVGWFAFRTLMGAALPLLCVGLGILWALGSMAALGRPLNLVTSVVLPVVNAVGIAYGMHLISELDEVRRQGVKGAAAVWTGLSRVASPILLCALTTVAGFLSLCTSELPAIREFGLFCSIGTLGCAASALWLLPCALAWRPAAETVRERPSRLPALAARCAEFDLRHRRWIFAGAGVLVAVSAFGASQLVVSMSLVDNFAAEHPLRRAFVKIDERLRGSNTLHVVVETERADAFKAPESLRLLESLQRWLEQQPEIGHTTSIADYVRMIHRAVRGDDTELRIPDSERLVDQLFFFFWDEQLTRFVDGDFAIANIEARVRSLDSAGFAALDARITERLASLPPGYRGRVTGNTIVVVRTVDDLSRGQAVSLATGLVSIGALLLAYFRSLRVALLALLPNVLPVLAYFGALGLTGVTLNPTTALVACIVLGVAVDDTLHYFARFRGYLVAGMSVEKATVEALRTVARPVALTTLTLCGGLLALATSELRHQVEFGVLASATLLLAAVLDATLTPALASLTSRNTGSV